MSRVALRTFVWGACLTVLTAVNSRTLCAQDAKRPPFPNNEMRDALSGGLTSDAKAKIDTYFDKFFWVRFDKPLANDDFPNLRQAYRNMVRGIAKSDAHDYLVEKKMLPKLRGVIGGKYSQTAKYNAMLMLGELNEDDKTFKPHPEAFKLVTAVAAMNRPDFDYLKPAALVSLARMAENGAIPKESVPAVSGAMLAIVNQKDPPPGRNASAHAYIRRNAAQVLALLGNPGADNSVLKAFDAMLSDPQASLVTRCELARYIGLLKFPPASKVDVQGLANRIGHQAVDICQQEVERASKQGSDNKDSRRVIAYVLESSDAALAGLLDSAEKGSESQKFVSKLRTEVASLLRTVGEVEDTRDAEVPSIVEPELDKIREILLAKPAAGGALAAAEAENEPARPAGPN